MQIYVSYLGIVANVISKLSNYPILISARLIKCIGTTQIKNKSM